MTYTQWIVELVAIICADSQLEPSQIALNENELKQYYADKHSPTYVYHIAWDKCAGNYFKTAF